ncbi:bile acid:sodium symporter, partial [Mesorhizobium sp. M1A.F.Ca.IN.022.05.2.1]
MNRLLPDLFTVLLISTVAVASVLPVHGPPARWFAMATDLAIALLFFLHGARLSRDVVLAGMLHWRLHLMILLTTFAVFPALGLAVGFIPETILPASLYAGILFLCML